MGGEATGKLKKPQLRGLLMTNIKRSLIVTGICSFAAFFTVRHFLCDARKKRYAEFYKTYDADAAFERMRQRGVFDSCAPDN